MLLVATCYAIAAPLHRDVASDSANLPSVNEDSVPIPGRSLIERCRETAVQLRSQLPKTWNFVVVEPYVLGGDLRNDELMDRYEQTIVPIVRALSNSYFSEKALHPISILLCSSDEAFRDCNLRLDQLERNQYSGLYSRKQRRLLINIASGEGTLAHELTHALAHVDFPAMPEWFDEGLASLHEECRFSADGTQLIGDHNWRTHAAMTALNSGELRLLKDVVSNRFGAAHRAATDYAYVRTFCLYLQQQDLLQTFYRLCKQNALSDRTGLKSLCQVAGASEPKVIDDAFREWLLSRNDTSAKPNSVKSSD